MKAITHQNPAEEGPAVQIQVLGRLGAQNVQFDHCRLCNAQACNGLTVANSSVFAAEGLLVDAQDQEDASNIAAGSWYRLARLREYPHQVGTQVVDAEAVNAMAGAFARIRERRPRAKLPIYRGHPDFPGLYGQPEHDDSTVIGEVVQLEARADGLWGMITWTDAYNEYQDKGPWQLSPRWRMDPIDILSRINPWDKSVKRYRPTRLMSVGLVKRSALGDGAAVVNLSTPNQEPKEKGNKEMQDFVKKLLQKLGYSLAESAAFVNDAEGAPAAANVLTKVDAAVEAANALESAEAARATIEQQLAAATQKLTEQAEAVNAARDALLADAREAGRLTEADVESWQAKFAANFAEAANALAELPPKFKTRSTVGDLQVASMTPALAREKFREAVHTLEQSGLDAANAWTRAARDNAELYKAAYPTHS